MGVCGGGWWWSVLDGEAISVGGEMWIGHDGWMDDGVGDRPHLVAIVGCLWRYG